MRRAAWRDDTVALVAMIGCSTIPPCISADPGLVNCTIE